MHGSKGSAQLRAVQVHQVMAEPVGLHDPDRPGVHLVLTQRQHRLAAAHRLWRLGGASATLSAIARTQAAAPGAASRGAGRCKLFFVRSGFQANAEGHESRLQVEDGAVHSLESSMKKSVRETGLAHRRRGFSVLSLVVWMSLGGLCVYILVLLIPALNEYIAVSQAVRRVASPELATRLEKREAFDKQREIDNIQSISGKDLMITMEKGYVVVAFSYDRPIVKIGNALVLIRFSGSGRAATY